jgi:hypothetical protein
MNAPLANIHLSALACPRADQASLLNVSTPAQSPSARSVSDRAASDRTAARYRAFADEARGRSPQYEELTIAVADDPLVLGFLDALPPAKRQPNLLFAAAYYLLGAPVDIRALRGLVTDRGDDLARTMLTRRTQTNEPARCATLLPALALLPPPLALIEVGASAGLTLLPDRYFYDYDIAVDDAASGGAPNAGDPNDGAPNAGDSSGGAPNDDAANGGAPNGGATLIAGTDPDAPVLSCRALGPVPVPARVPDVAWRAGLDLNPLDVTESDDVRWLECLIWPGETGRRERLAAAIETARRDPPPLHRGDLLTDLAALAGQAPPAATLVVYHSAVLAYVAPEQRGRLAETTAALGAVWLSNEGPSVLPGITGPERDNDHFLLVQDGTRAIALTDPHGTWLEWLP